MAMFGRDKSYKAFIKNYGPKMVEDKEDESTIRVFEIKLEIPDPIKQGIGIPCKIQDDKVVQLKWIKQSGRVTVEFIPPGLGAAIVAAGSDITINNVMLGGEGWVMPVRVRAKMSSDLAQYLYKYFASEVAVKIYDPQGSLPLDGNPDAPSLEDRKQAAGGDKDEDAEEGRDEGTEAVANAESTDSVFLAGGVSLGTALSGDTPPLVEGAPGETASEKKTAKELHDKAVKAQEEGIAEAKPFGDAWEKLKNVPGPVAKAAMTWLAGMRQDVLRPEAVRKEDEEIRRRVRKMAIAVIDTPFPPSLIETGMAPFLQPLLDEIGRDAGPASEINTDEKTKSIVATLKLAAKYLDDKYPHNSLTADAQQRLIEVFRCIETNGPPIDQTARKYVESTMMLANKILCGNKIDLSEALEEIYSNGAPKKGRALKPSQRPTKKRLRDVVGKKGAKA